MQKAIIKIHHIWQLVIIDQSSLKNRVRLNMFKHLTFQAIKADNINDEQLNQVGEPNRKQDTFYQDSLERYISPLRGIPHQTPYFAQSSIKQGSDQVYSIQEFVKQLFQKDVIQGLDQAQSLARQRNMMRGQQLTSKFNHKNRQNKMQKIMGDLNKTHKKMKLDISKIKEKQYKQMTLKDTKHKDRSTSSTKIKTDTSPRYKIAGNITDRYSERLQERCKTETVKRQEKIQAEMKECTFHPYLLAKRKSTDILALKKIDRSKQAISNKENSKPSSTRQAKDKNFYDKEKSRFNFQKVKSLIKCQINSLKLF